MLCMPPCSARRARALAYETIVVIGYSPIPVVRIGCAD